MGKYKQVLTEFTVGGGLDLSEIESLRDEMRNWESNLSGTALENTEKYQMVSDAADTLERVDSINLEDLWTVIENHPTLTRESLEAIKYTIIQFIVKSKRQSPSRSTRMSNAISMINGAMEALREFLSKDEGPEDPKVLEFLGALDDLESDLSDFDNVEFPGMYG